MLRTHCDGFVRRLVGGLLLHIGNIGHIRDLMFLFGPLQTQSSKDA
ncbi:MAG: hypothetical protein ACJA1F_002667 [Paracoccaceae bacterium]|jgi:hypothetical protein